MAVVQDTTTDVTVLPDISKEVAKRSISKKSTKKATKLPVKDADLKDYIIGLLEGQKGKSLFTLADLKDIAKVVGEVRKAHNEYQKPVKKVHIENRKLAEKSILDKVFGFKRAILETKKILSSDEFKLSDWIKTGETYNEEQAQYALSNYKKAKLFMSENDRQLTAFSPRIIINAICKAATLKEKTFNKTVELFKAQQAQERANKAAKDDNKAF